MATRQEPASPRLRAGALITLVVGVISITPLLVVIMSAPDGPAGWLVAFGAAGWLMLVGGYHGLLVAHTRRRHNVLRRQVDAEKSARRADSAAFRDRLNDHAAILERIITIGEQIVADGITDPHLTLDSVRLLTSHARDAEALTEDTLTQIRLESDTAPVELTLVDLRDQIDLATARFPEADVTKTGTRHFAYTDPTAFRVLVRSLVTAAIERGCRQIDVAAARDGTSIVCTVSDDAPEPTTPPRIAIALAQALDTRIEISRRIGRNHFSFSSPAAPAPASENAMDAPLDVIGDRPPTTPPEPLPKRPRVTDRYGRVVFPEPIERDDTQTVAARRGDELLAR